MSDSILERLREAGPDCWDSDFLQSVADEIERLQHDLSRSVEATTQYLNEAERQRADLLHMTARMGTIRNIAEGRLTADAQQDIGRLAREALFSSAQGAKP